MGTSCIYQQVLILIIPWIINGLNTYTSDGDTYWISTATFIPIASSKYGTIRLRQHIRMSFNIQWNGRTSPEVLNYEQIFRIGWPSATGACAGQNSRYPSLWIDNVHDVFHLSISQDDSCGQGWRISSYPLEKRQIYKIYIEFTDTRIFMIINDTIVLDQDRTTPTRSSFIGNLMDVFIASDRWGEAPYIITNASLWNIAIQSLLPTTTTPTVIPTLSPTSNPTISPITHSPSIQSIEPTPNPTHTPTLNPSPITLPKTPTQTTTQRPTIFMQSPTTERPTISPTFGPNLISSTQNVISPNVDDDLLLKTNVSTVIYFETNQENIREIKMNEILIVLITGIASCLIGTLFIFIAVKKCGDIRKGSLRKLSLRKIKVNTEDSFSHFTNKHKVCVPLKAAKEPDILRLGRPHPVPAPAEKYVITVSNPLDIYDIVDEGNETSHDTQNDSETEIDTAIMCGDGIEEEDTVLTQTESMTMSPSHAGSRLHTNTTYTLRKYLMSESNEEDYINAIMEQAVVIHHPDSGTKTTGGKRGKNASHLLVINDVDEKIEEFNHNEDMRENIEILDEDNTDDDTLPVLPDTTTTTNDGESFTVDMKDIKEAKYDEDQEGGYQWIASAFKQIDSTDWRGYVENFKRNKVTESRLSDLKRSDLKELIPTIGPRNEFERLLRDKLGPERSISYEF